MLSPRFAGQAEGSASTQTEHRRRGNPVLAHRPDAAGCAPERHLGVALGVGRQVGPADLDVGGRARLARVVDADTWTSNGTPGSALAGARSTSSGGQKYGGEGSHFENGIRYQMTELPPCTLAWSPEICGLRWLTLRNQNSDAMGALGADPAEPKTGEPEVVVGHRERPQVGVGLRGVAKRAERGGARDQPLACRCHRFRCRSSRRPGRCGSTPGPVYWRWSASTFPSIVSTRRSTGTVFAAAVAATSRTRRPVSAHGATSRKRVDLSIKPPLPRGSSLARPGTGLLASGVAAAPSQGVCVIPSGRPSRARDGVYPVTVAGPRRLLTGLPLTTDRMLGASLEVGGRSRA